MSRLLIYSEFGVAGINLIVTKFAFRVKYVKINEHYISIYYFVRNKIKK